MSAEIKQFVHMSPQKSSEEAALLKLEELVTKFEALLAKLDTDGVGSTNYYATLGNTKKPSQEIIGFPKA
jgi:hypothetical protein